MEYTKKIYIIQPTYRLMDGKLIKQFPLFNYSYNLPILSGSIPLEWQKQTCLEYIEDVDFSSDSSIIIISSMGYDISHSIDISKEFKKRGKTVIFGAHMDDLSDTLLKGICDSVFYGYPTPTNMKELIFDFERKTLKSEYHFDNNINFPFDYSVLNSTKILFIPMIASLGCRYKCSFCCYPPIYDGHYHLRKLEYVINDLRQVAKFKKPIAFLDANLFNNRKYLNLLCNRIIDEKVSILWGAQCTVDIGKDSGILKLLYKAGCRMLFLGLESLDNKNMELLNKPMDVDHYKKQIQNIHSVGICIGAFFMLGLDSDDKRVFKNVYHFFQNNKIEVPYVHLYVPVPGTSLAEKLKSEGRILEEFFNDYLNKKSKFSVPCNIAYFTPAKFTREELEKGFLNIFKRLMKIRCIIRRSLNPNWKIALIIFKLNLEARKKSKSMVKNAIMS